MVQAAGTSAWQSLQQAVAQWFGRGDGERERVELERLDRCATALAGAQDGGEAERVAIGQQSAWQARLEQVLESLDDGEREQAVRALRALLEAHAPADGVSAPGGGQAVGGNVYIRAEGGSAAALRMRDLTVGTPPRPDRSAALLAAFAADPALLGDARVTAARALAELDRHRAEGIKLLAAFADDTTCNRWYRSSAAASLNGLGLYRVRK